MNPEASMVGQYIAWLSGEQWAANRPRYRSRFFDNRMDSARRDSISLLTSGRPSIEVHSKSPLLEPQALIAENCLRHSYQKDNADLKLAMAIDICFLWGASFWKIGAAQPGVMRVLPCGPDCVMPVQPGWNLQESTAVVYKTWKPASYFHRTYPYNSAGIEQEASATNAQAQGQYFRPNTVDEYTWNAMSPGMKRTFGNRTDAVPDSNTANMFAAIDLTEIYVEDWSTNDSTKPVVVRDPYVPLEAHNYWYTVMPGKRLYPRKRLVVFGGKRLLYDGPSPYWHGKFPFACLRLDPVPWSFWGKSKYRNLLPINRAINEIGAGTLDLVKRALNPIVVTKTGAVPKPAWDQFFGDQPGGKLMLGPNANVGDVRYMEQPPIPAYVAQFLAQYAMPEFDRMAGMFDATQLSGKRQAPGGDTIQAMKDSMQATFQLECRRLEGFLEDGGELGLSNIFQFWTAEQRMKILGRDGITFQDFDYDPKSMIPHSEKEKSAHWLNYSMTVTPGSLHSGAGDRKKLMAIQLYGQGAISRPQLHRDLEIANSERITDEIYEDKKRDLELQAGIQQQVEAAKQGAAGGGESELIQAIQSQLGTGGPPSDVGDTPRLSRGQRNGAPV